MKQIHRELNILAKFITSFDDREAGEAAGLYLEITHALIGLHLRERFNAFREARIAE